MNILLHILLFTILILSNGCSHRIKTGVYKEPDNWRWGYEFVINKDNTFNYTVTYRGHPDSIYVDISTGSYQVIKDTLFLSYKNSYTILLSDSTRITEYGLYKPMKLLMRRNKLYYVSSENKWYSDQDLKRVRSNRSDIPR